MKRKRYSDANTGIDDDLFISPGEFSSCERKNPQRCEKGIGGWTSRERAAQELALANRST